MRDPNDPPNEAVQLPPDHDRLKEVCTKVAGVIDALTRHDRSLTINQAHSLLMVALHPGLTVTDLARQAGITLAAASRHVARLGTHRGLGLILADISRDGRLKPLRLTAKGRLVVEEASRALRSLDRGT